MDGWIDGQMDGWKTDGIRYYGRVLSWFMSSFFGYIYIGNGGTKAVTRIFFGGVTLSLSAVGGKIEAP